MNFSIHLPDPLLADYRSAPTTHFAATALEHGLTWVTRNTSEFQRVEGLAVEDWLA